MKKFIIDPSVLNEEQIVDTEKKEMFKEEFKRIFANIDRKPIKKDKNLI